MSLHVLANHMASKGRGGDSMLVHMTPGEVQTLQKMAEKLGGTLTINPETGLPEANFLKKMLPMIAGLALAPLTAGTSLAFLGAGPLASALTVGGITGLATGSLSKGLTAGLGAFGGASLGASLATAGTGAITSEVGNAALTNAGLTGEAAQTLAADEIVQKAVSEKLASATPWEKIGAGFGQVTSSGPAAWDFAKANKGPLTAAGMSYMAGQDPAKLDIPTATREPAMIRPLMSTRRRRDPNDPLYNPSGSVTGERNEFVTDYTVPTPYRAATGGIVALADGGMSDEQLSSIGTYLATNPSASDLSAAMQQFGVSQADVDRARSQMAPASNAFTQAQSGNTVIPGASEFWSDPENKKRYDQQQMEEYQKGVDSSNAFLKLRQATGQENTPFFSGKGSLSSGADSAAYLPAMYEQYGIEIPELAKTAYQQATGQAFQSGTTPTAFNAQSGQYTIGGAELPQATQTGPTRMEQMAQAGQGVQWGSGQSEAGVIEQMRSQGWSPEYMAQAMGVPVDTISGAINRYDLGVGREKDLASKRAAGTDLNAPSPWALDQSSLGESLGLQQRAPAPTPAAAPSPFTVGGAKPPVTGVQTLIQNEGTSGSQNQARTSATTEGQDLSGTVAGAFVGPRNTVITYDATGKQTDTGRPASFLNEYLSPEQRSETGTFLRSLSWGKSPEEDAKSTLKLKDYARARGLNEAELLKQSGLESPTVTATGLKSQFDKDLSGTAAGAFVGPNGTVITYDQYGKQTDTGRPASALNDYLTGAQESDVGAFVRGLSWGVSPEEDAKSSKKLYDYAKARGLSASELIKQSGLEGTGVTAQGLQAQWAQWNVTPNKPVDPYDPGSPVIKPPPGKAPIPAPKVPVNPPKPPGWTGITETPIPPKPLPTGGIPTLTTLTGDPYGLTPPAKTFTPPTRTGRSAEIYDYLSGKKSAGAAPPPKVTKNEVAPTPISSSTATTNSIQASLKTVDWTNPDKEAVSTPALAALAQEKGWTIEQISAATGIPVKDLNARFDKYGSKITKPSTTTTTPPDSGGLANGGMTRMAGGGLGSLGGYSDGGQLLRGPGDGVSDHIPATIGDRQPARLADGEFVVPARIVSELGNGSTEAGARSLYRMMDRVQAGRKKSIGKGKVAVDSRAENYLPA